MIQVQFLTWQLSVERNKPTLQGLVEKSDAIANKRQQKNRWSGMVTSRVHRKPGRRARTAIKEMTRQPKNLVAKWFVPIGLVMLAVVPVVAGAMRLTELSSGPAITPANARFVASPVPVVLHIISVTLYSILGAFQFARHFRRRRRGWHRVAGWMLIPSGLTVALSGLWMSQFYALPTHDGELLYWLRLVVGWAMVLFIILGTVEIGRRNFTQHGAWMMRAYALGMGAGTQLFTLLPWMLIPSIQGPLSRGLLMGLGWTINVAVAEWVIYKRRTK